MAAKVVLLLLAALLPLISADKILAVSPCSRGRNNYGTGQLHEVRITPCPEAASRRPCVLHKNSNVTIEVDFTPSVATNSVSARAYWANRAMELPLPNMNTNACESIQCPMPANVRQSYKYVLPVSSTFPNRRYDVRWKMTGAPFNFCFQFPIQILNASSG